RVAAVIPGHSSDGPQVPVEDERLMACIRAVQDSGRVVERVAQDWEWSAAGRHLEAANASRACAIGHDLGGRPPTQEILHLAPHGDLRLERLLVEHYSDESRGGGRQVDESDGAGGRYPAQRRKGSEAGGAKVVAPFLLGPARGKPPPLHPQAPEPRGCEGKK